MSLSHQRILIIGGGFSGMAAAIELRKQGAQVDLVEIDPGWRNYGAGISLGDAKRELVYGRVSRRLRECVLSKGNTLDPAEAYRAFRGRDPDPAAPLIRRALSLACADTLDPGLPLGVQGAGLSGPALLRRRESGRVCRSEQLGWRWLRRFQACRAFCLACL